MSVEGKADGWEPKIVGFCCNWCSYAGADLAGTSRMHYPATIRVIRVPCSGRVNPQFILKAFQLGADGVLVAGCHPGDCHYSTGNLFARRRMSLLKNFLAYLGIEPERLELRWISGSEGQKFAEVVKELSARIRELGPSHYKGRIDELKFGEVDSGVCEALEAAAAAEQEAGGAA